jgi:hypothetical protein
MAARPANAEALAPDLKSRMPASRWRTRPLAIVLSPGLARHGNRGGDREVAEEAGLDDRRAEFDYFRVRRGGTSDDLNQSGIDRVDSHER